MTQVDFSRGWSILAPSSPDPVTALAAAELGETLQRTTGHTIPLANAGTPAQNLMIVLSHDEKGDDGFEWQASPDRIDLHGHNARGLLYAAYSLLESLGCRWVAPGKAGERLPRGTSFTLPDKPVQETPALFGRCLIIGHYAFMDQVEDWVVWAAHNRLNTIFLHVTHEPLALGSAPESQWQAHRDRAVSLARQRGVTIEHGGHWLSALLPRNLFKQMPNAFRYHNGRRTPDHNFCPTDPSGLAVIRRNAEAHFRAHPEADVFHLWPDDIPGGGWCACERCREYTPSEQALLAINAVAEALETVSPRAQIAFLAYHDTEDVPTRVAPRHNVCLLWAPRKRCYAHSTNDPACPVNVPHYADTFRAQVAHFRSAMSSRVFEYYLDAILFKSALPPLPTVMQHDLGFYRDVGAHTVQALMTGDYPWLGPQLNAWLFARLAWNPDQELDALLADFCQATFGTVSPDLPAYYRALEQAFALALDIVPEQIRLEFDARRLWDSPLTDMGDPAYAPPEVLRRKCQANAAIPSLLEQATHHLEAARRTADSAAWAAERAALDLYRAWLLFDLGRVKLYEGVASTPIAPDARQRLDEAQAALDQVLAWGEAHLADPRYRVNFRFLHWLSWQLRMNKIRADYFAGGWRAWVLKVRSLLETRRLFLRVRKAYR